LLSCMATVEFSRVSDCIDVWKNDGQISNFQKPLQICA
jgi:hypothetical protein